MSCLIRLARFQAPGPQPGVCSEPGSSIAGRQGLLLLPWGGWIWVLISPLQASSMPIPPLCAHVPGIRAAWDTAQGSIHASPWL